MASPKFQLAYTAAGPAGSPSRIRAGKRITAHRLAHIPEDARPTYLALRRKGVPRAEAEAAALAQLEHDLAQFRARLCPEGQRGAPMP